MVGFGGKSHRSRGVPVFVSQSSCMILIHYRSPAHNIQIMIGTIKFNPFEEYISLEIMLLNTK